MSAPRGLSPSSSDVALSSPPQSPGEGASPSTQLQTAAHSITVDVDAPRNASLPPDTLEVAAPPARKKPGRKPKASLEGAASAAEPTPPKAKRTRKLKDPNAPPVPRRKKQTHDNVALDIKASAGGPQIIQMDPTSFGAPAAAAPAPKSEAIPTQQSQIPSFFTQPPSQQAQVQSSPQSQIPLRTSGQNYDPIRSNYDPVRETSAAPAMAHSLSNPIQPSPGAQPGMTQASASPSIASLVELPKQSPISPSVAQPSFFAQPPRLQSDVISVPPSPNPNRAGPLALGSPQALVPSDAMIVDESSAKRANGNKKSSGSTATSSATASPKPLKMKEAKEVNGSAKNKEISIVPPPLPGSGLMQLGPTVAEYRAPTVVLNFPFKGKDGLTINFSQMAEKTYGWDALHPRLAAQRDRLARVAAAGAALERNGSGHESGDDMSLDSDAEASNVEMGGMSDGKVGTDGGPKKVVKKRKMKEDEYDKDDGFVDDTELAWEQQSLAVKDGFFVYSGPLPTTNTDKPAVETRADGIPKRGRGSRGGRVRGSTRGAAAAARADRTGLPASGPGSRGGVTRKPRITKADRARMEAEKAEREKAGLTMGSPMVPSQLGTTPMVFN